MHQRFKQLFLLLGRWGEDFTHKIKKNIFWDIYTVVLRWTGGKKDGILSPVLSIAKVGYEPTSGQIMEKWTDWEK